MSRKVAWQDTTAWLHLTHRYLVNAVRGVTRQAPIHFLRPSFLSLLYSRNSVKLHYLRGHIYSNQNLIGLVEIEEYIYVDRRS